MSVHQLKKMKVLLGQVIGTKMKKTAKVRVERLVLDKYVMQYYSRRMTVFAHDEREAAKEGDVVLVKLLPLPRSRHVKYDMERIVYSQGNVTDPITGKKCDGYSYWDDTGSQEGAEGSEMGDSGDGAPGLSGDEQSINKHLETERQVDGTPV